MSDIAWQPEEHKPANALEIEAEIDRIARGGVVRLTMTDSGWRARALLPGAMCARGGAASDRDVSEKVEEVLADYDCPVAGK